MKNNTTDNTKLQNPVGKNHNKNKANYIDQLRRDKQKQDFCIKNEIKYIEIYDGDEINKDLLLELGVI